MNAGHIKQMDLARQLYASSAASMQEHLPAMGASLELACLELSHDLTIDRLDRFSAQLNAAQTSLQHLRKALATEETTAWGTG